MLKKNGAIRICIDFRNLNLATPKDAYPMPISDLLIDAATNHDMLSFMDGHAGYNQIFITEADVHKNAFRCLGALGTYEWDPDKFECHEEHRAAFTQIKVALATPPVLVPPQRDKPLKLYILVAEESIGCLLAQDTDAGREQSIFYLSRNLNTLEINYSPVEKPCLALFFSASKLRDYMLPSVTQEDLVDVCAVEPLPNDWKRPIMQGLDNPIDKHDRKTKVHATNYISYQNELYRKGEDGLLLLCLDLPEAAQAITEVHEGIYGAHQSGRKMRWLLCQHGFFWPSILKDCIEYARGCIQCQIHGPIQRAPTELFHSVTKPWSFKGWAMDVIGKIMPSSEATKHAWILVATDYFTKWVKPKSYAELTSKEVCDFVEEHIVTRFGIP
nr:uncharacterized protein LOC108174578 [Malus domestica]